MPTDQQIVATTLRSGSYFYTPIIEKYSNYVFAIALRISAGNHALAEDICQNTFLKSFRYLKSYDSRKPFKSWLASIAIRCAIDQCQKEQKHIQSITQIQEEDEGHLQYDDNAFFKMIRPLSSYDRSLFVLKYLYQYSNAEIAAVLDTNENTVKSKIHRNLKQLKDEIDH